MRLAVPDAAAVLGSDDHVAAIDGLLDERKEADAPSAMDAAMDPHHRRVAFSTTKVERLEQVGRNIESAGAAAVRNLPVVDAALADFLVARIVLFPVGDVAREVA